MNFSFFFLIYYIFFSNSKIIRRIKKLLSYIVDVILYNDKIISLKFYYSYNIAIAKNNILNILNVIAKLIILN